MWTIYNIHRDLYWNEEQHCWCPLEQASGYSAAERDRIPLRALTHQWRYVVAVTLGRGGAWLPSVRTIE